VYINYNPLKASLVTNLEDLEFSNYLEWIGKRNGTLFDDELLKIYSENPENYKNSIEDFKRYMKEKEFSDLLIDQ